MRKRIVPTDQKPTASTDQEWLNLDDIAEVEVTSEDPDYPVESALLPGGTSGWRAATPGEQTIRLLFATPQSLHRIRLEFVEPAAQRTQEYVLRWSADGGRTVHEVVRQQWNFSPRGATEQTEDKQVDLEGVTMIELSIVPNISGGTTPASLSRWRLA